MMRLITFTFQDYMDLSPEKEHRWMDVKDAPAYVGHMNAVWSGGHYASSFTVLTKAEALAFADSDECNPDSREWLREQIIANY